MNLSSLLFDGLKAMVLGMLWVYVFLSIMILCMKVMSKALAPFSNFLEPPPPTPKKKKESGKKAGTLSPEDRIRAQAAIEAAKRYRADHRNSASKAAYTVTVEGKTFNVQFKEGGVITADLAGQAAEGEAKKPTTASSHSILSSGFVLASMVRMTVEWSSVCVLFRFFFIYPLSFVPVSDDGYDGYDG